jgi:predicted TIM-barrel fold metal-dependent hydrolase
MKTTEFIAKAQKTIANTPYERMSGTVKTALNTPNVLFDIHMHIFDKNYAAKNFFLLRLLETLDNNEKRAEIIENFYQQHQDNNIDDLLKILDFNNMQGVLNYYYQHFSCQPNIITTPLTMDLRNWLLKPRKNMVMQVNEMKRLIAPYPILPFLATDPASATDTGQANLYNLFLRAFTGDAPFFGVKIYPSLGYLPSHPALIPIYQICEQKRIPVTTHCGGTVIRAHKTNITLSGYQIKNNQVEHYQTKPPKKHKAFATFLNDPALWEPVLKMFPNLKLNLGHFGGTEIWETPPRQPDNQHRLDTIKNLMQQYPNVYADFSFNMADPATYPKFIDALKAEPLFLKRAMFGTDYWVVLSKASAQQNQMAFVKLLEANNLKQTLMKDNPLQFLLA